MSPYMNIIWKNQEKSMNYIFQVGIDFGQTRMYGDFDWSDSGVELDFKDRHGGTIQRLQKSPLSFQRIWYPINTLHRTLLKYGY